MNWPDVRPVLLMAVKAQARGGPVRVVPWGYERGPEVFVPVPMYEVRPPAFDPPSHDGTDPWKWGR